MARTVRDAQLDSRASRIRLKARGRPYWRVVDTGLHLGYRKGKAGGRWVMRMYQGSKSYQVETIATADDVLDADGAQILSFSQVKALACRLFVERRRAAEGLPSSGLYTVGHAIDDYLRKLEGRGKSISDARYKVDALIVPRLGGLRCEKLKASDIERWLHDLAVQPARTRSKAGGQARFRPAPVSDDGKRQRRATANRVLTILKAALNDAWKDGKIASTAWRRVAPFKKADAARVRYLTMEETRRLLKRSSPDFGSLVRAALATGARYGELTALLVNDFNPDSGTLHIRTSKSGLGRHVVLTEEGVKLFQSLSAGRAAGAPMLQKTSGERWRTAHQLRPMRAACVGARIDPAISFHGLRHTYASHTIMNGAPLMVVAKNLGHADTRMVESTTATSPHPSSQMPYGLQCRPLGWATIAI